VRFRAYGQIRRPLFLVRLKFGSKGFVLRYIIGKFETFTTPFAARRMKQWCKDFGGLLEAVAATIEFGQAALCSVHSKIVEFIVLSPR
jgi:hypothetical protein